MKKEVIFFATVTLLVCATFAARRNSSSASTASADTESSAYDRDSKILIDQAPKLGQQCCLSAPTIQGSSMIGACYAKPRRWIVCETKYTTFAKFVDQLTFNWHVILETRSAKENKGNIMKLSEYSYFNCTTTYYNIPQGSHAACVCLPPSYLELYGEPKAIGFEIKNQNGETLGGCTVSEIRGISSDSKFWEDQSILSAVDKEGKPLIERRQGLVDRSKTIWALVNPNDYEATVQ